MPAAGALLCLASAACFGAMGIFGRLAFDDGVTIGTLLVLRFAGASLAFWALLAVTGRVRRLRAMRRRDVWLALALGAFGYSTQAGSYFAALDRIDPGLLSLLLYTYPAIVAVAAIRLGRARASRRTTAALALTSGGLVLVVAGAGAGALDAIGALLGVLAAAVYAAYILTSEGVAGRTDPLALSTLVCTGATATLLIGTVAAGDLHPGAVTPAGFGWLAAIVLVSTVAAVTLFFAGLRRVGPTAASILSTFEPLVAVVLAGIAFGEGLSATQLCGGALILGGVVALNARRRPRRAPAPALADA